MVDLTTTPPSLQTKHSCNSEITNEDTGKRVLIYTDGGPDHNNTFLSKEAINVIQVTNKDGDKTLLIYTDGGPDHNNTFLSKQAVT